MQKRRSLFSYFLVLLFLSLLIFAISRVSFFKPVNSFFQVILSPFQAITYGVFSKITTFSQSSELKNLKEENSRLVKKIVDQSKILQDNKALRDQFQTESIKSSLLTPANVIGAPGFIPGISVPQSLVLDRGENDGVKVGNAVIYKDNLVGKVTKTSQFLSVVVLITNSSSSFTAKTLATQGLGVVKGQGGDEILLDNVLLSDSLKKDDAVLTKGDVDESGSGFPPNLVVGKITSVSKSASDLFQKAEIKSFVDFSNLEKVFIITGFN